MKKIISILLITTMLAAMMVTVPSAAAPVADVLNLGFTSEGVTDLCGNADIKAFAERNGAGDKTVDIAPYMSQVTYDLGKGSITGWAYVKPNKEATIVAAMIKEDGRTALKTAMDLAASNPQSNGFAAEIILLCPDPKEGERWYPGDVSDEDGVKGAFILGSATNAKGFAVMLDDNGKLCAYFRGNAVADKKLLKSSKTFSKGDALDIVWTYDGNTTVSLYANGELLASKEVSKASFYTDDVTHVGITNDAFSGGVNNAYGVGACSVMGFKLYSAGLSSDDVKAAFESNAAPVSSGSDDPAPVKPSKPTSSIPVADVFSLQFTKDGITDKNNGLTILGFNETHQDDNKEKGLIDVKDYMTEITYNLGKKDLKGYAFNKTDKSTNIVGVFTDSGKAAFSEARNDSDGYSVEIIMTVPDPAEGDKWYPSNDALVGGDGVKGSWIFGSGTNGGGWGLHFDENGRFAVYMRCKDSKNIMKSKNTFAKGQAVDVIYAYNGDNNVSLYVNGVLEASMDLSTTGKGHTTSSTYIGITNDAFNGGINGAYSFGASSIIGYNVYSSCLSAKEAKAVYNYHADPSSADTSDSFAVSVITLVSVLGCAVILSRKKNH